MYFFLIFLAADFCINFFHKQDRCLSRATALLGWLFAIVAKSFEPIIVVMPEYSSAAFL
jgi:hypothetical protein